MSETVIIVMAVLVGISFACVPAVTILNMLLAPKCCGVRTIHREPDHWHCYLCGSNFRVYNDQWYKEITAEEREKHFRATHPIRLWRPGNPTDLS